MYERILVGTGGGKTPARAVEIDLMVLGNEAMTGPGRFLLGSVPNKVSHHGPIAVPIVGAA